MSLSFNGRRGYTCGSMSDILTRHRNSYTYPLVCDCVSVGALLVVKVNFDLSDLVLNFLYISSKLITYKKAVIKFAGTLLFCALPILSYNL